MEPNRVVVGTIDDRGHHVFCRLSAPSTSLTPQLKIVMSRGFLRRRLRRLGGMAFHGSPGERHPLVDGTLVDETRVNHELLQCDGPAVSVRTIGVGGDRRDEALTERFAIAFEAGFDGRRTESEHARRNHGWIGIEHIPVTPGAPPACSSSPLLRPDDLRTVSPPRITTAEGTPPNSTAGRRSEERCPTRHRCP